MKKRTFLALLLTASLLCLFSAATHGETVPSPAVTYDSFLADLKDVYENAGDPSRIDADVEALQDPVAAAIAAHWKEVYLDPDYPLYLWGRDDPGQLPITGRHAFAVLGYQLTDGAMTDELVQRCDAAAAAAKAFPNSILVCTGGATGSNNPMGHTEAGLMRDHLVRAGIAAERIFIDERAMTTAENAVNTLRILQEQGIETLTLVTSGYHQRWAQVLYNAMAAIYLEKTGYSVRIVGNFSCDIAPRSSFRQSHRIALSQLGSILNLYLEKGLPLP